MQNILKIVKFQKNRSVLVVVNAADVPTNHKEEKRKSDRIDSKKLARTLRNGNLKPIYISDRLVEEWRFLNRHRFNLRKDMTRLKGRFRTPYSSQTEGAVVL